MFDDRTGLGAMDVHARRILRGSRDDEAIAQRVEGLLDLGEVSLEEEDDFNLRAGPRLWRGTVLSVRRQRFALRGLCPYSLYSHRFGDGVFTGELGQQAFQQDDEASSAGVYNTGLAQRRQLGRSLR